MIQDTETSEDDLMASVRQSSMTCIIKSHDVKISAGKALKHLLILSFGKSRPTCRGVHVTF
jgi:hypothetical protein